MSAAQTGVSIFPSQSNTGTGNYGNAGGNGLRGSNGQAGLVGGGGGCGGSFNSTFYNGGTGPPIFRYLFSFFIMVEQVDVFYQMVFMMQQHQQVVYMVVVH